ncbi:MAG: efflux RND transporter permease subunit [Planctomycetaceae bacterium]|nr:efflux RND transporter permease subunit [Planctomycetaceae bacterium]
MASFLLQRPRILLLSIIVVLVAGLSAFWVLPRLEDPVLGRRVGIVGTVFPGANAQRVESLVTIPIEEQLQSVTGIRQVRSNSQTDISNVVIELEDEITDVNAVWATVRDRLEQIRSELPDGSQPPQLDVVPLKAFATIIRLSPASSNDFSAVRSDVRSLKSLITSIAGTESVSVFGDPGEEIVVNVALAQLARLGLPPGAIAEQLIGQQDNFPAGRIREGTGDVALQVGSAGAVEDRLAQARITWGPAGDQVRLADIATVSRHVVSPPATVAPGRNGAGIVLGVMVQDDERVSDWDGRLQEQLQSFRERVRGRTAVEILFSQSDYISERMSTLLQNLGYGTLAVMAVVLLMMGWRSMLIVTAALPLSALMVLAAMRLLQIPLHQMSVTGLIVALGLLIDNAIVIVDEVRHRRRTEPSPLSAISLSLQQLAMPLFGSTLTTVLAFLPIAMLPGPAGEFVGTIAVSVILAVASSFLLAMTVIPALAALLPAGTRNGWLDRGLVVRPLSRLFEWGLRLVLRFPMVGVLAGIVLPAVGFVVARQLPEQFFPSSDRPQLQIEIELASRESIARTEQAVEIVRSVVSTEPVVAGQHWFVGGSAPTFYYNVVPRRRGTPFYAQGFVDLSSTADLVSLVRRLQLKIDQALPQGRALVRLLEQGPPFDAPVEVRLLGPEQQTLQILGRQIRSILQETDYVIHTRSDLSDVVTGVRLTPDEDVITAAGLNTRRTAGLIYTMLEGAQAGRRFVAGEELPVRVRLQLDGPLKSRRLTAMPLPQQRRTVAASGPVPDTSAVRLNAATLGTATAAELESRAGAMLRINGRRASEVKAYAVAGVLPSVVLDDFQRRLAASDFTLPQGYELKLGGEKEQRTQAVNQLIANAVVLFSIMLLTLVASFQSFRCAAIVASVGGLATGLGPLALTACRFPFGFMAIVGTMGLVGVAINDSIVVLAALRANRKQPPERREPETRVVLAATRHVLATTLTTIVGFLPLVLSGGRFWPPLAVTIAGGVGGATLLALLFVPAVHALMFGSSQKPLGVGQAPSGSPF